MPDEPRRGFEFEDDKSKTIAIAFRIEVWRYVVAYLRRAVGNPAAILKLFCYFALLIFACMQADKAD
ncbi:MAG: hypothetical protein HC788_01205 [Sphingopyxis sp.]|nr:hypothetical protein [Sphingopyxis sp.]